MIAKRQRGHILVFTISVLAIIFVITGIILSLSQFEYFGANRTYLSRKATYAAEAGLDHAIRELNKDSNYPGETIAIEGAEVAVIVTGSGNTRQVDALASIPNAANPTYQKKLRIQATLDSTNVQFFYGIQVGAGGLTMANNSRVNGNVYSNGTIQGSNGAVISGDVIVAGGLPSNPAVESTTENTDQFFGSNVNNRDIAQAFTAAENGSAPQVAILLAKVGNPSSGLTLRITNDASGKPSTSSLASSTIPPNSVGLTPSWINVSFSSPPTLVNGVKYWIVLDYNSHSSTNHWNWRKDGFSLGSNYGKYTDNWSQSQASWTDTGGVQAFKVWQGGFATSINDLTIGDLASGTGRANAFNSVIIRGSSCPNIYCIVDNPPPQALPISDGVIEDWKNAAAVNTTLGDYTLEIGQSASLGPRKIEGNMTINNSAILTLTGTVYVTGNIFIDNLATIKLDPGYMSNSGVLLSDGIITVSNNVNFQGASAGSNILVLTALENQVANGIICSNGTAGSVIYYAGKSRIQFANVSQAKEATAWGINMDNGATITYESGLANSNFTAGPGGGWTFQKGSWEEVAI